VRRSVAALGPIALCATLSATAPPAAQGAGRPARCDIWYRNAIQYDGPCRFRPEGGGSFSLSFPRGEHDLALRNVARIRVRLVRPGVARVSADDAAAAWGRARRSRRDRACWSAPYWHVCAY
jgi:hypothetical protein